jgi:DNA-directed RNA polymerase subunit alpha
MGNSLRRILLSSLEGAAITHVKIDGVRHEFSSIPGVVEDVTEIILNLKRIRFKLSGNDKKVVYLDVNGKSEEIRARGGVVTAEDISPDAEVEILTPDYPIATIDDENAEIKMELEIENGKGYVPADRQFSDGQVLDGFPSIRFSHPSEKSTTSWKIHVSDKPRTMTSWYLKCGQTDQCHPMKLCRKVHRSCSSTSNSLSI